MKNLFSMILGLMLFTNINGQNPNCPPGSNQVKPDLDKFVGTWRYVSGSDTFLVYLDKQAIPVIPGCNLESIVGWHRYVKNGLLIESSAQYAGQMYNNGNTTIVAGDDSPLKIIGGATDLTKQKSFDLSLTMDNLMPNQLRWQIRNSHGLKPEHFDYGATLPWNVVLSKL